jgi:hypothetical protein
LQHRIGTFVIEFVGNGTMSRVIVKKGTLSLVEKPTAAGHQCYIIDSDKNICRSENTGIWCDDKFYESKPEKNGAIFVPYSTRESFDPTDPTNVILKHGSQVELVKLDRQYEAYSFDCITVLNPESLLLGNEASLLLRPILKINNRRTSSKLLKNIKVDIKMTEFVDS